MSTNFDDLLATKALSTATPGTLPLVRRSAYLADALRSLGESGGQNLRSPWALGANLLADALLNSASKDANAKLATAQTADRASLADTARQGLGSALASAPTPGPSASPNPPPAIAPPAQAAPAPQAQGLASVLAQALPPVAEASPSAAPAGLGLALDPDVVRTIYGEDRKNPKALASVIMNRAKSAGMSPADVVRAPGQFGGWMGKFSPVLGGAAGKLDPSSPEYQRIAAAAGPILSGAEPPITDADHFWAPAGMPGGRPPSWAAGATPQAIGSQQYVKVGYGAPKGFHPSAPQMPPPSAGPQMAQAPQGPPPNAQPYQVASLGPTPPPPNAAAAMSLPPSQAQPAPPAMSPPAGGATPMQGPPHGLDATPEERALFERLVADPRTYDRALAMAQEIAQRRASPLAPPKDMMWSAQAGRFVPMTGTETHAERLPDGSYRNTDKTGAVSFASAPTTWETAQTGIPGVLGQRSNAGKVEFADMPGARGAAPEGTRFNPATGGYAPMAGAQPTVQGTFTPGTVTERSPGGKVSVLQQPEYSPAALGELRFSVLKSEEYKQAGESLKAWQAMTGNAGKMNGMSAYAMRDTFARAINPGAVTRQGTLQAIEHAQGIPEGVKSFFLNLKGDGDMSPVLRQQVIDAVHPFVVANMGAARALNDSNADYAKRHGLDARDVMAPLDADPARFVLPSPGGQRGSSSPGGGGGPGGGPGVGARLSPQEAARLPRGARFVGLDGVARIRQ